MADACQKSGQPRRYPLQGCHMTGAAASISDVLVREFKPLRSGDKICAKRADAPVDAARNWLYGRSKPSVDYLIRLMASVPAVRIEVDRLVALQRASIEKEMSDMQRDAFAMREKIAQLTVRP